MSKEGFAITRLEDAAKITRPRGQIEIELTYSIKGTDEEIVQIAREDLDEGMRSLSFTKVERGGRDSRQFFYSEKKWKAPWNPHGPKPPWAQNPENN